MSQPGEDISQDREKLIMKAESEFSRLIRKAALQERFGRVGLIVHMQAGTVKTLERHDMETFR